MNKKSKTTKANKSFREDLYGIILLVVIVLFILFIGYSSLGQKAAETTAQSEQDFAGKAFAFSQKILPKEKGSCTETDMVTAVPTGFNPFERGQIVFSFRNEKTGKNVVVTKSDHCRDSDTLIEFNCDNYATTNHAEAPVLWTEVNCDYGCDQEFGKCRNS